MAPALGLRSIAHALLASTSLNTRADESTYTNHTVSGINTLQSWYNTSTGLWDTTGWWNSANCLQVLAEFSTVSVNLAKSMNIDGVIMNTFNQAQRTNTAASVRKAMNANFLPESTQFNHPSLVSQTDLQAEGFAGFINDYYDDEGWWALALIRSYDVTRHQPYLDTAASIFEDMQGGADTPCGGIWWSKNKDYVNAIANELYLAVAASLANRVGGKKSYYQRIAAAQWAWFKNSSMINSENTINDGLTTACKNNGYPVWSYNQGVVLGGLVELWRATGEGGLIDQAHTIAHAAINALSVNGILREPACEPNCGGDGPQFKGIFVRNLRYLHDVSPKDEYRTFILANADSIWDNDRSGNQFGLMWAGPFDTADASRQSSALDAMVAAIDVY